MVAKAAVRRAKAGVQYKAEGNCGYVCEADKGSRGWTARLMLMRMLMQMQMQMSRQKKKSGRLAMKSGFGEAALEGRGACVEPRRGVAITRPQRGSGQLWWGVALPLLAQYLRRQRWIGRLR